MFSQGGYNLQSGQGTQTPRPPPFIQHPPALPPLPQSFQQGPLLPLPHVLPRPGQPGLPIYQHGPLAPHLTVRQVRPGLPNTGQPYFPPPPTVHGSARMPHVYTTAPPNPQGSQHSSYLAPGLPPPPPPPPPSGSHHVEMLQAPLPPRSFPPTPSQGPILYRAPFHQLPQQPGGVQGLQQTPPPPPPLPTISTSSLSGNISEATAGNSQMSSMVPPSVPPPPLPSSSPPPIPPPSPPRVLSAVSVSVPLPAGSNLPSGSNPQSNTLFDYKSGTLGPATEARPLNQAEHSISVYNSVNDGSLSLEGKSGNGVKYLGEDGLSSKRIVSSDVPCPPKPTEEKIVQKIEEFCHLISKNGSSYEERAQLKEPGNPEFKFLFGGEPGSEAAVAHEYFLWMKRQCLLACKSDGNQPAKLTTHLIVTTEIHSPGDSDMEMEDDITRSDADQAVNQPIECPRQAAGPGQISSEFDATEQMPKLVSSGSDAATMVLSERLGEEGSKLVSSCDGLTFGRSILKDESPVINSTGDTEYPFASNTMESSTILAEDNSSSKAAAAVEFVNSDSSSGQVLKGSSPFRLLQDYASNDSSENDEDPHLKDANPETISPLVAVGTEIFCQDAELGSKGDIGSKSSYSTEREFGLLYESGMSYRSLESSSYSHRGVKETAPVSTATGLSPKLVDIKYENQSSIDHAASRTALPKEDALGGAGGNVAFSDNHEDDEDKNAKFTSNAQKIDKFGRLVREGASDSDSDDSPRARRRNKRGRSRSRSPLDKRRNRPQRRREKRRSRSRSWSPRNRRSRSRSPSFRRSGEFSSGNRRLEKGQLPECFDFLRGRCYRGASCRYMHHDSEKRDGSRNHKSKQQKVQLPSSSKNCDTLEGNKNFSLKVSDHGQEIMDHEVRSNHDMFASSICAAKDNSIIHNGEDSVGDALVDSEIIKSDSFKEVAAEVPKTRAVEERSEDGTTCVNENFQLESDQPMVVDSFPSSPASDAYILKSHGEAPQDVISSLKDSVIQQSQSVQSDPGLEDADNHAQQTDDSSISDTLPDKTSRTSPKKLHVAETLPNSADSAHNPSGMAPFPPSAPEGNNAPHMAQLSRDYKLMPQTAAFQSQSASENFPSYMLPNQNSLFSLPSNSSSAMVPLTPPPPPPPPLLPPHGPVGHAGSAKPSVTLQFQQSSIPPTGDFGSQMFLRPHSTEFSGNSQVGEFQHRAYPPLQEPHQPHLHLEGFRLKPLPGCPPSSQQFGGTLPFSQEGSANKMQSLSGDNLVPGEILKSSTQIHPYLQWQQAPYSLHQSVPDSVYSLPGKFSSSTRYPPDLQDKSQPSHFRVLSNSSHFNPFASTFEKPLSSRFSSDVFRQEKDTTYGSKHDTHLALSHASLDGQCVEPKVATSPTSFNGVGKMIPMSGGNQYDPLFDSIEPSSNSYKKSGHIQNWEPSGGSDIVLRLKGANQPLDVEENNKKKEVDGIALVTSIDTEEFGETADLEVGNVENGSQSNPNALTNTNMGEMEIDQIKSPGKNKRSKESRSMKLFKACLADFVKEVLKPSWRQGNMSKETFKTVVKKTVDKVSEAMKSHQIPKSKAKINHYIDSSQRKLTKLVMGYVDKYAKG